MSMYICRGWPEMPQGSEGSVESPKAGAMDLHEPLNMR